MDILGVGFPELILIFIIALMIFGPRRLPEIAVKLGKTVRDLRNMSSGLMTEWQREITVAARLDELEKARQEIKELKEEINETKSEVASEASAQVKELKQTGKELEEAARDAEKSVGESASRSENTIKPPSSAPPPTTSPAEAASE